MISDPEQSGPGEWRMNAFVVNYEEKLGLRDTEWNQDA